MWLLAAIAVIAVVAFGACKEDKGAGKTPTPPTGERIDGGTLTVATTEGDKLDPHQSSFAQEISFERMLWRGPYTLDKDDIVQPAMAAELPDISDDGKTYTITLRDGLLWSDDDALLAEDFVMGILRTCNPDVAGEYQYVLSNVVGCDDYYAAYGTEDEPKTPTAEELEALKNAVGVRAIDDTTYEITLANPQPTFTIILSLWVAFPVPVHLFPNPGDEWPAPAPDYPGKLAYNGPYIATEYENGDHATLAPNPNWAGDVKPTLDTLVLRFIDDFAVADRAYEAGEVDFAYVNLTELKALRDKFEPTGEYLRVLKPTTTGMEMNLEKPPLDNLDVRLALVRADDHELENEVCYQGGRVPSTSWLPDAVRGGAPPDAYEDVIGYDPEAAKQHLADAGYPNGEGFPVLTILVRDDTAARCLAEQHQAQYKENLNIDTKIEVVDSPTRSARFKAEDFDLFPGGWQQDYPDPENWIIGLYDTGGGNNHYNCSDPEIDDLVAKAQFNTNDEERIDQYHQINELIVTRVCGIGPFMHVADHYLIKPYVVGMAEFSTGQDGVIGGDWNAEAWGRSE
ncbi:MAG: peptide ABC transporter substrate-binding protein [Dehalococcoidia bacterium]|nr:peptide ABC transporter substrate-binding protein [Dehalococcoidia bacterium]